MRAALSAGGAGDEGHLSLDSISHVSSSVSV
jgi:hypothetical protein